MSTVSHCLTVDNVVYTGTAQCLTVDGAISHRLQYSVNGLTVYCCIVQTFIVGVIWLVRVSWDRPRSYQPS